VGQNCSVGGGGGLDGEWERWREEYLYRKRKETKNEGVPMNYSLIVVSMSFGWLFECLFILSLFFASQRTYFGTHKRPYFTLSSQRNRKYNVMILEKHLHRPVLSCLQQ